MVEKELTDLERRRRARMGGDMTRLVREAEGEAEAAADEAEEMEERELREPSVGN